MNSLRTTPVAPCTATAVAVPRGNAEVVELSPASRRSLGARAHGSVMAQSNLLLHASLLSGVAGYVDAAGFVAVLGLFPAHVTGELVGDAIAMSAGGHAAKHAHLWVFPVFIGSVTLATLVARVLRHYGRKARAGLLALVTLALALFSASDALAWLLHEGHLPTFVRGGFAVAAMGFQSALMRESLTGSCATTVMTGNLTQVVIDLVDQLAGKLVKPFSSAETPAPMRLTPVASSLFVFAAGAGLGGWLTQLYGSLSVALPTLLTAALVLQAWREDAVRRAAPVAAKEPVAAPCVTEAAECSSETRLKVAQEHPPKRSISGVQRIRIQR